MSHIQGVPDSSPERYDQPMTSENTLHPLDITPLVSLYWFGAVAVIFGIISWITAGANLHPTDYLGASTGTDATAAAWLVVGSTATTIGTVALIAGGAAHAVIAYLIQRDTVPAKTMAEVRAEKEPQ